MYNIDSLSSLDFYFNNAWLSSYNGIVAGRDGLVNLSLLPQLEIKSEKILGRHGELVYDSTYNPRTFTVPVLFSDISNLRNIANWLNVNTPQDFYFKNDTVKIKCMLDSVLDIQAYNYQGVIELKFIAHYPFFNAINDKIYSIEKYTSNSTTTVGTTTTIKTTSLGGSISFSNDGNVSSYPKITVYGAGTIVVSINTDTFTVVLDDTGNDYVTLDSKLLTVYKSTTNRLFSMSSGVFPKLNYGNNLISVTGNCTKVVINCNSEWI